MDVEVANQRFDMRLTACSDRILRVIKDCRDDTVINLINNNDSTGTQASKQPS